VRLNEFVERRALDLRERALARKEAGETNREIAVALRISPSCVSKWTKRKRETGSLAPTRIGGYKARRPSRIVGSSLPFLGGFVRDVGDSWSRP
jgi:hypothetical protein